MAIIDLDQGPSRRTPLERDRGAIVLLVFACAAFALAVWITPPAARPTAPAGPVTATSAPAATSAAAVPRGIVLAPLQLPPRYVNVDLGAMPDRLANEAAPWTLRSVITVRGVRGVGSVEGPAMITWTENGIAYWLVSPTRSTAELINIANELR